VSHWDVMWSQLVSTALASRRTGSSRFQVRSRLDLGT
jgi:hypothetical protein